MRACSPSCGTKHCKPASVQPSDMAGAGLPGTAVMLSEWGALGRRPPVLGGGYHHLGKLRVQRELRHHGADLREGRAP